MPRRFLVLVFALLAWPAWTAAPAAPAPSAAPAVSTTLLDRYLDGLTTWSAQFRQAVVDSRGRQLEDGEGRLVIVRPGKFRWESAPAGSEPGTQLLIADGRNLWFYDRDLEQATVRPMADSLSQSPAMLLAGAANLRAGFELRTEPRRDGLDWVRVRPRDKASDFREALFGFQAGQLVRMVIVDKLGQRSTLRFTAVERNQPVDSVAGGFQTSGRRGSDRQAGRAMTDAWQPGLRFPQVWFFAGCLLAAGVARPSAWHLSCSFPR